MSNRLQLDVRNLILGRLHLVNAYEVKTGIGVIAGKMCDPCLSDPVWSMPCITLFRPPTISSLKITDRSFRYASPRFWNQLPDSFRQPRQSCLHSLPHSPVSSSLSSSPLSSSITLSLFHSQLKTYLFNPSHLNTSTMNCLHDPGTGPDRTYHASRFIFSSFLPCDAMHKRGYCRHAVSACMSVRLSVCLSRSWVAPKRIKISSKFFSPSGSQAILVFPCQTGWRYSDGNPLTGASNARQVWKNDDFRPIYRSISETVIVRWAHSARQFVSIEFSFRPYNV